MNNKQEVLYIQVLYYRDVLFTNLLQIMFCGFYLLMKVLNLGLAQKQQQKENTRHPDHISAHTLSIKDHFANHRSFKTVMAVTPDRKHVTDLHLVSFISLLSILY